jgi:hypothetical protein
MSNDSPEQIQISRIASERLLVPIIGTMPLIMCKFSEKAKREMLDNMQGRKSPKTVKNPREEFEAVQYRLKDGWGMPALAFKAATIGAARFYGKKVTMTELRQLIFFKGELSEDKPPVALVPLTCDEPEMREDYVRVGQGTDLRYRPEFRNWSTTLDITYVTSSLSRESLLSLVDAGGMGGVGEWRPAGRKSTGEFGTYMIDQTKDIEVIKE